MTGTAKVQLKSEPEMPSPTEFTSLIFPLVTPLATRMDSLVSETFSIMSTLTVPIYASVTLLRLLPSTLTSAPTGAEAGEKLSTTGGVSCTSSI